MLRVEVNGGRASYGIFVEFIAFHEGDPDYDKVTMRELPGANGSPGRIISMSSLKDVVRKELKAQVIRDIMLKKGN